MCNHSLKKGRNHYDIFNMVCQVPLVGLSIEQRSRALIQDRIAKNRRAGKGDWASQIWGWYTDSLCPVMAEMTFYSEWNHPGCPGPIPWRARWPIDHHADVRWRHPEDRQGFYKVAKRMGRPSQDLQRVSQRLYLILIYIQLALMECQPY